MNDRWAHNVYLTFVYESPFDATGYRWFTQFWTFFDKVFKRNKNKSKFNYNFQKVQFSNEENFTEEYVLHIL